MTGILIAIEMFHFLRPWFLLLIPAAALLWWYLRHRLGHQNLPTDTVAPHLLVALTVGQQRKGRLMPIDLVAVLMVLTSLGASGPTWSRVPDPFVAQTAPLVIALHVSPSMQATDVQPSRLDRAKQKIRDLLAIRAGARSALVAYGATAHSVVPMTEDPNVLQPYLEGLQPDVMPDDGNDAGRALDLANDILADEDAPGGVLFVTDALQSSDVAGLSSQEQISVAILAMLPQGKGDAGLDAVSVPVAQVAIDDGDIAQLERALNAAYRRALAEDGKQPWDDKGWILAWPAALLVLLWFRRGWTMRWSMVVVLCFGLQIPGGVRAEGVADWFLTADQQGQIAFDRKDFTRSAELYLDPMHKGYAQFRDGQYPEAIATLSQLDTPEASFVQGMASLRNRGYRDAIDAFQLTLDRDPDFPGAAHNLVLARKILEYVESTREQSDTGEHTGEGADDIVFDNEDARGADTQIQGREDSIGLLTADQWMNTVDTDTGDFLRQRFAIEAARQ
ncbi:VWA domain-containing protein [Paracoccus sp. Z330]|uniref:VWA domain-containing protein n=1 Tax=Paracoccus onchidii TaxID=3017813 RepID=A0ABT4ZG80_9RHOB|nr:VWA domain-containing protein [Paracoccus onchidii]MDB6178363.1 VWA domain-containing protein [Paracoccus onchidii]